VKSQETRIKSKFWVEFLHLEIFKKLWFWGKSRS